MSAEVDDAPSPEPARRRLAVAVFVTLVASRLYGLGRSLWQDEAYTAWAYVVRGPDTIRLLDAYLPNNHLLYSWLTWQTSRVLGVTEPVLRLWAVVPALLVATLAIAWSSTQVVKYQECQNQSRSRPLTSGLPS